MIKPLVLLAFCSLPLAVEAQAFGGGLGWWTTTGGKNGESAAHGLRVHVALTRTIADRPVDFEGAFSQAQFSRTFSTGNSAVTENSIEIAPLVRLGSAKASWWPYLGPVASIGIGCGTDGSNDPNGRVACNPNSSARSEGSMRLGAAAGLRFAKAAGTVLWTADLRAQANTIAAARGSGPVVLIAVGLRGR